MWADKTIAIAEMYKLRYFEVLAASVKRGTCVDGIYVQRPADVQMAPRVVKVPNT